LTTGRAVRANLSLDAGLLDAIDEAAKAHGSHVQHSRERRPGEDRRAFRITRECISTGYFRPPNPRDKRLAAAEATNETLTAWPFCQPDLSTKSGRVKERILVG